MQSCYDRYAQKDKVAGCKCLQRFIRRDRNGAVRNGLIQYGTVPIITDYSDIRVDPPQGFRNRSADKSKTYDGTLTN